MVQTQTHVPLTAKLLQAAFRDDVVPKGSAEDFQIRASKDRPH